jgi:hypothetical protein
MQASSLISYYSRTNEQNNCKKQIYHNLNTSNGTMGIHTFAQHHKNDLQSLQFFIPQSLKALQQHNSRSPNLTYNGSNAFNI